MAAWPEVLSAAPRLETLEGAEAAEIEAIAAQIIPSTGGPGAREAGVIYFIDRALGTFAAENRDAYRTGMAEIHQKRKDLFPNSTSVVALSGDQQIKLIRAIEKSDFFDLLRTHTILGFLANPSYGGNRDAVGWKQIGFEDHMTYQHPFGYYDTEGAAK
jgi:gluconate 2-dehydrogenase gamma chain